MTESTREPSINDRLEAEVRRIFEKRFEKFVITEKMRYGVYRSWYCAEPKHYDCSFTITTIPGRLFVTGDLGLLCVERCYDMLPWCRGSVHSTAYFAEKVPHEIETTEFSHERLEEWIRETLEYYYECDEITPQKELNRELLHDLLQDGLDDEEGEDYFRHELSHVYDGCDPPNWHVWKRRFLILREAVRWFVTNHSEPAIIEE